MISLPDIRKTWVKRFYAVFLVFPDVPCVRECSPDSAFYCRAAMCFGIISTVIIILVNHDFYVLKLCFINL